MIRKATIEDKQDILSLITEFYTETLNKYPLTFNIDTIKKQIDLFIDNHIVLVSQNGTGLSGLIAGGISCSNYDTTQLIVQEFIWYVKKQYRNGLVGVRLLKALEDECKKLNIKTLIMVSMNRDVNKYYKRNNFQPLQMEYIKSLDNEI